MSNLETIIALASKIYIAKLHAYKLDHGMRNSSTTLSMDARVFHYTYDRG
jgi:hypothetical protein